MDFRILQAGMVSYGTFDKNEYHTDDRPKIKNVNFQSHKFF